MPGNEDPIIIQKKIQAELKKPLTLRIWVVAAIAIVSFAAGAWLF